MTKKRSNHEYDRAFHTVLRIDAIRSELAIKTTHGRFGEANHRRLEEERRRLNRYLTPTPTAKAIRWQRPVVNAAWEAFRTNPRIPFPELLDAVMKVPDLRVEEEAVRRFLNKMGFRGKPGRPRKTSITSI
jgi:hypothetical protein